MTAKTHEMTACEVCGNRKLVTVFDLGTHPILDDLVPIGDKRVCKEYPIEVLFCNTCRTAHQRFLPPKQDVFPDTYHYRSRFTKDVLNGMAGLVDSCEQRFGGLTGKRVLDIGCNDGSLLNFFRAKGAVTIGIEPTSACRDAKAQGHATYQEYLSERVARAVVADHGRPDVITFTNVFAHIENFTEVLASLRALMSPSTVIVIENHYLGAVLDGKQFDTFYHEHARTYSYTSFVHIAKALGVQLSGVEFPSRYGGNIRVFLSKDGGSSLGDEAKIAEREARFLADFESLQDGMNRWRTSKKAFIAEQVRKHGPLRAKAFPGRAAILIKLLGLDRESILAVHEQPGSMKVGHYVPGTRIPIVSDEELFKAPRDAKPLLNLAWHIPREIREYLAKNGYQGPVVDIIESQDLRKDGPLPNAIA